MYNKSLKIKILEEAFNSFLDIIDEYASQHGLSKIEYYLEDKLSSYSSFLEFSTNLALKNNVKEAEKSSLNILYVKQLKQLVTNG